MELKLKNHPYSNCKVVVNEKKITFVSYRTPVVEIDENGYVHAGYYFNCSPSTRKQVGWFLKEYTAFDYHYLKIHAFDGMAVHRYNGDCIPE